MDKIRFFFIALLGMSAHADGQPPYPETFSDLLPL